MASTGRLERKNAPNAVGRYNANYSARSRERESLQAEVAELKQLVWQLVDDKRNGGDR